MRIMMRGFIYTDYMAEMGELYREMGGWIASGAVTSRETVREGIEAAPQAFLDLFSGGNTGKMLVRL
jgi:NADPH-dependent curcumin reductase CurA